MFKYIILFLLLSSNFSYAQNKTYQTNIQIFIDQKNIPEYAEFYVYSTSSLFKISPRFEGVKVRPNINEFSIIFQTNQNTTIPIIMYSNTEIIHYLIIGRFIRNGETKYIRFTNKNQLPHIFIIDKEFK